MQIESWKLSNPDVPPTTTTFLLTNLSADLTIFLLGRRNLKESWEGKDNKIEGFFLNLFKWGTSWLNNGDRLIRLWSRIEQPIRRLIDVIGISP